MTRRLLLILLSLLVLALASGCTRLPRFHLPFFGQLDEEALPDPIRIGLATDAPPLSWREDGRMHGLDPHLAAGIRSYARRNVRYVTLPRNKLLAALRDNQVDVAMAALTATEVREQQLAATRGYLQAGLIALARLGQERQLSGQEGLRVEGVRIGTVLGGSGPRYAKSIRPMGTHQIFANTQAGIGALVQKRIDVLLLDMPSAFYHAALHIEEGLMPGGEFLTRDTIVWALRPEDKDLHILLNAYLQEQEDRGSLAKLISRILPFYNETKLLQMK